MRVEKKKIKSQNKELWHNLYLTFKHYDTKSKTKNKIKKSLIARVKHVSDEASVIYYFTVLKQ